MDGQTQESMVTTGVFTLTDPDVEALRFAIVSLEAGARHARTDPDLADAAETAEASVAQLRDLVRRLAGEPLPEPKSQPTGLRVIR